MFSLELYSRLPVLPQLLLHLGVLITFIYMCYQYRRDAFMILIVLMFYSGLFEFFGSLFNNVMKIVVLGLVCWCTLQRKAWKLHMAKVFLFTCVFVIFTIAYFVSVSNSSGDSITIICSQFSRYVEFYLLYFLIYDAVYNRKQSQTLLQCFYKIILIQIIISLWKLFLFQRQIEGLVGTLSVIGGAMGTSLPILGFIILYFYRDGRLSKWDWLFVAGLMLIGYTTGKRAIWFILPIVITAFLVYVRGMRLNKYLILGICAAPIVFYFGARLTPSLNPENQVWGSFDLDHIFDYAETYQFGKEGLQGYSQEEQVQLSSMGGHLSTHDGIEAEGRGGATIALLKLLFSPNYVLKNQDLYGLGFSNMYSINYATFNKLPLTIHIDHKGSATGLFQSYVTTGVLGVFTTILLMFFPFFFFKQKRLQWVILAILVWEYFMYTGIVFRTPGFMAILLFVLHDTNKQYADYQAAKQVERARQRAEREAHYKEIAESRKAETLLM